MSASDEKSGKMGASHAPVRTSPDVGHTLMGRPQLFLALLFGLVFVSLAWFLRSGRWRERRLWLVTAALLAALALLSRRVGWAELAVVAAVITLPGLLFARRPPR